MILAALVLAAAAPQSVLTIDPRHRIVEGVATDGSRIWVSSLVDRQILQCEAKCAVFATLPTGLHPFAIAWDGRRKQLWVAADCPPGVSFIKPCERGALIAFDARSRIRTRITPAVGTFHPGDVAAAKGEVFVSDSQNGAVFRLTPNGRGLKALVAPGIGKSGQGMALSADGNTLIVADYSQGITSIDLATGARSLLPRPNGKPLRGVDGLVRCGSTYYGVYNGAAPGALLAIAVTDKGLTFDEPLADATLPDPTQITFDGKRLLIVADSGWATIDKPEFVRKTGAPIVSIPLAGDCKPL